MRLLTWAVVVCGVLVSWGAGADGVGGGKVWGQRAPVLLGGEEGVVFSFYGAPSDVGSLRELVGVLEREGLANGFDPGPPPYVGSEEVYDYLVELGWPVVTLPPRYGEFQIKGGRSRLDGEQEGLLKRLEGAGIFAALQLGEWGYYFHELSHNEGWWRGVYGEEFEAQRGLMRERVLRGYDRRPGSREEAYAQVREYYLERNGAQRGWNMSVTGHSHYECYAAEWGTRAVGVELGENIAFTQSKLAFTRGAARQWGLPFSVQVSPWYGRSCTTAGALRVDGDGIARGMDAGHSLSFYRRMWLHAWFAGAALVTPENSAGIWFEPGEPKYRLTEHARAAVEVFKFMRAHERGTPYMPLAVVIDRYAGYNGYQGKPWGIFENTEADLELSDFLEEQLFPGADHVHGGVPPEEHEGRYLRPTPYGEIADVFLSTVPGEVLRGYPVVLLAGEVNFDEALVAALSDALRGGSRVLLHARHVAALGDRLAGLREAGDVEVLEGWVNPATGRGAAIGDARLRRVVEEGLPVRVSGGAVQYQVNRRGATGWVVELVNNAGVDKRPDRAAVVDEGAGVVVRLELGSGVSGVLEWWTGEALDVVDGVVSVRVPAGESRFVAW